MEDRRALVIGASGISGYNVAQRLLGDGWSVSGISRRPPEGLDGLTPILVDLQDRQGTIDALANESFTHAFYCTWARHATEAENCDVNGRMLQNVLDGMSASDDLAHVALVTGLKHYQGPFERYAERSQEAPFREDMGRLPFENFYYTQEDILFEEAARHDFSWSVHRSHTLIGWALGNAMNMGVTLAVYGTICREQGRPFVFPGSPHSYSGITDVTDAELLADQMVWSATTPAGANQALNTVNGDVFRWRRLWQAIADELGATVGEYRGHARSLEEEMAGAEGVWDEIVARHNLLPRRLDQLASWWHTDGDLGREVDSFADMSKSRTLGFAGFRQTDESWRSLIRRLREAHVIP
jgi:nucleoside-diphosphate-sugar epimerase